MNILTLTLFLVSLSALPGNAPKAGNARAQSADEKPETSGTFHLSDKEPTKHLSLRGKTGIVKINNMLRMSSTQVPAGWWTSSRKHEGAKFLC
jgi:hypothetical protein